MGPVHYPFEHFSGYGMVEPTPGERLFLEVPSRNTANFQIFLKECAEHDQETLPMVVMDHGSGHTATSRLLPSHGVGLCLPP
jgi:hypothetical protein